MRDHAARLIKPVVLVVAIATALNIFARGFGETFTVFLLPLGAEFGWSRATLTSVYSLHMLVIGVSSPLAGAIFDRFGPRIVYSLGLTCIGIGSLLSSYATTVMHLYVAFSVIAGFGGAAVGIVSAAALIRRWVDKRLGSAMGVAYAGLGLGVMLLVPSAQLLIDYNGWRDAFRWLGVFVLLLAVPVWFLPWARLREGDRALAEKRKATPSTAKRVHGLRQAVRQGAFWGMFNVYFFTSLCVYVTNIQVVVFLVDKGFAPITAATAFGLAGMLSIVGVVSSGAMVDKYGPLGASAVTYACTILGIVALILVSFFPVFAFVVLYVLALGMFQGSRGPIVSTVASRVYGGAGYGAIFGAINLGMGFGAAVGSWLSGLMFDMTGGYLAGFICGICFAVVAFMQFVFVPAMRYGRG